MITEEDLIKDSDIDPVVRSIMKHKTGKTPSHFEVYKVCSYTACKMRDESSWLRKAVIEFELGNTDLPSDLADWKEYHFIFKRLGVGTTPITSYQKAIDFIRSIFE